MPYTWLTRAQLKTLLLSQMDDSSAVYYTNTGAFNELNLYINDALYTWQAMTGYWRQRQVFNTVNGQAFYDLSTFIPSLLAQTITDQTLIAEMEYHLLEPGTPAAWSGTSMFVLDDFTQALQRRRNQFLSDTGCVLTHSSQPVAPTPIGREALTDDFIDVRRVAWVAQPPLTDVIPLWRNDEWAYNSYNVGWSVNPATPSSYSVIAPPPLQIQLSPVPIDIGALDILSVRSGATLDPTVGVLMGVPDNLAWVVKWGALADLLSRDGEARDVSRAAYCEQRWQEGCELTRLFVTVVQAEIDHIPVFVQSVSDLDAFYPSWGVGTGTPASLAMAGLNMLAIARIPDAGPYSIACDVVRNAPVPVNDASQIQIGREALDAIMGEVQHLAAFKMGGAEFAATIPLHQNFVKAAAIYNDKLKAQSTYLNAIEEQSHKEEKRRPRRESDVALTGGL